VAAKEVAMRKQKINLRLLTSVLLAVLWIQLLPAPAEGQAPFYEGKTITIIQARQPGGLGDLRVRALIPFLRKYIPGNPSIASEYMPGGGGRKAANHLYNVTRPDGLTIANVGAGLVSNAILGQPGIQYDVDRFVYLGTGNSQQNYVFATWGEANLKTLQRLQAATGVRIGAQAVGHDIYIVARLFAWLMDLKDSKFITGYGGPEIDLAMARGEVDARANNAPTVVQRSPEWIEKKLADFHAIVEIPRGYRWGHPAFAALPEMESFARTETEKKVLTVYRLFRLLGSPYVLGPGVPPERVAILKEAFSKALRDPELPKAWTQITGEDASPLLPDEQARAVREIPRDPGIIEVFKQIAGGGPLPRR